MTDINFYSCDYEYDFNLNVANSRLKIYKSTIKKILNLDIEDSVKVSEIIKYLKSGYYQIPSTFNKDENIKKIQNQLLDSHKKSLLILNSDFSSDKKLSFIKNIIL